ncbi:multicopper oxidase domain-containing protein [Paenibacillus sp. 2TAB19]|uniref:multicopper oxidase domain-containing protein n=1 Tax=Paenibacillus sp. 2TAB19 TaxID=3233003 RepID=UPI003F9D6FC3
MRKLSRKGNQASSVQAKKGLLGKLIIDPKEDAFNYDEEDSVLIQQLNGTYMLNGSTNDLNIDAAPGSTVRVRMINATNDTDTISVNGAAYRIIAMDGHDLNEPGLLDNYEFLINTINGKSFHEIPPMIVEEGDRVKITILNAGGGNHPFHMHGHVFRVLSRNGQPLTGSPVYLDTLLTQKDETYEIYVLADNPGLWMMHCHDLMHASMGMSMMFNYEGIATPYRVGTKSGNLPDL